ncbi:3-deoxy-7-phosphoheptulonate synthase [Nostoc sp. UHCC 0702]|nr:3-deoxy-7-phosphoheptulonate synthase [Nostoc sp. UHCC 0702]
MIIVIKAGTPVVEIERIAFEISRHGIAPEVSLGQQKTVIGVIGDTAEIDTRQIQNISPFIEQVVRIKKPFKRVSLEYRNSEHSEVVVPTPNGAVTFGQNHPIVVVAGPCSVENEQMIVETAQVVKATGAQFLRGGAYKPRTSPYAFQGHGESALELLAKAREATGLGIITEVMDAAELDLVASVADVIQVGARNMQNFSLLKKVGATGKPVLLKRGLAATIEDWLMSAEYILAAGNPNVILCERGIRTFDKQYTRNTLDISAIPVLRTLTHLPIMIDPSHATPTHAEQFNQNINSQGFASANLARHSVEIFQQYMAIALMFGVQAVDLRTYAVAEHYDARACLSPATRDLYIAVRNVVGQPVSADRPYIWNDHEQGLDQHIARIAADIAADGQIVSAVNNLFANKN